jgi:hypothetical protein
MAGTSRKETRGVSLTRGSLILIGVAVLSVGGAAGFGVGFKVEQDRTKSAVKAAKSTPKAKTNTAAKVAQLRLQKERSCLASRGLHWPIIPGKFAKQVRTPPPGVSVATFEKGLIACYVAAIKGNRAPPTTGAAAGTG